MRPWRQRSACIYMNPSSLGCKIGFPESDQYETFKLTPSGNLNQASTLKQILRVLEELMSAQSLRIPEVLSQYQEEPLS